ncbi:hypothetical protein E2C01_016802 [Portunus trituberculatus]|uniref:Uncharacterized protein n=1 Tax=Portunus trituberculatus TaxID=210409 RepID=A0A5B7DQ11_PORTR|nr:hypothetical protein [Portunus trituberculatus]
MRSGSGTCHRYLGTVGRRRAIASGRGDDKGVRSERVNCGSRRGRDKELGVGGRRGGHYVNLDCGSVTSSTHTATTCTTHHTQRPTFLASTFCSPHRHRLSFPSPTSTQHSSLQASAFPLHLHPHNLVMRIVAIFLLFTPQASTTQLISKSITPILRAPASWSWLGTGGSLMAVAPPGRRLSFVRG